ncbi:SusD/RagB family nutrient-binding outer membrane lipoprotein [Flavivirga rizhaonensis]|uniref:SusD/RagB family nutrient-binding outer membrane lipoprotein n=1 Tax=Flavivirga rizhaonensis TaxID=2559571 RepID=A0A4S1DWY5_9FLAO|nr:SusD/RagB family nutrient-binding outer membrane lipoprotein [Flavivirga rizhaonensis]TGV02445.1 SusD/RagB family nutrient-binding outer membrane lipoprotein [Flavivirga rizhaonensis]
MKNIKFKRYHILMVFMVTVFIFGCSEYLDVDTDTDNPTVAPINQLLPNIEITVALIADWNNFSGEVLGTQTHQGVSRSEQDQYGTKADNIALNNDWNNVYLSLTDLETLITQADTEGATVYKGIGELLKAYMMSVAVDLWGDVPYTEATLLIEGTVSPVFDSSESVYQAVFDLIDSAKTNLNNPAGLLPGADDFYYAGSAIQWIKFANTLKLKLLNQIRLSSSPLFSQSALDALVAENNFFTTNADDFQFTHTATVSPQDERNQLFQAAYGGAQVDHYVSPWFYEILMGMNPNIHTNNKDPRIPYYWANQLTAGQFPRDQSDPISGDPRADYWDASTGFFTIRFSSVGPWRDGAVANDATFPGIFPCGGRYDDGLGFARTVASGTGVAPRRILTYDEFLYIQAELMQVGLIAGDPAAKLTEAVTASFAKVDQVVAGTGTTQTVPVLSGTTAVTDFIANIDAEFAAASAEKQLEIIMTQKWVATYGDQMDQYNDYRRTGYPVLADPDATNEYQLDNGDGFPLLDTDTALNNPFNRTFFWPDNELNLNENAPAQKTLATYRVFWDN